MLDVFALEEYINQPKLDGIPRFPVGLSLRDEVE
jgi:hypothetical protein